MLAVSQLGHRVFRNNVGAYMDNYGNHVKYGLGVGTSDLIGWTNKGQFLAIEVKRPGEKATVAQDNFIFAVNISGGFAFVAHSASEAVDKLKQIH
jgi:hypothetical protein